MLIKVTATTISQTSSPFESRTVKSAVLGINKLKPWLERSQNDDVSSNLIWNH